MKDIITLAVINLAPVWGDKVKNLNKIIDYIEMSANKGSKLIVFPEGALTGYEDDFDKPLGKKMQHILAETIPGESSQVIAKITKKYGVYVVFGMPEKEKKKNNLYYNAAVVCGPEGIIGSYRKIHLTNEDLRWATRGFNPFMFNTPWGPIGVSICYDTYEFPEVIRFYQANGCRLCVNCTVIDKGFSYQKANISLQYYASIQNIYIATSNFLGIDKHTFFIGGSSVIGPENDIPGFRYYAGRPFGDQIELGDNIEIATIDLSYGSRLHFNKMWDYNPKINEPNWRPKLYIKWLQQILENSKWDKKGPSY